MAEPAGGHCQSPKAYGGPLLHHPHPAGTNEGKGVMDRGPQAVDKSWSYRSHHLSLFFLFLPNFSPHHFPPQPCSLYINLSLPSHSVQHCICLSLQCRCISALHPPLVTQVVFLLVHNRSFSSAIWPLHTIQVAPVYEIILMSLHMILL